LFKYLKEVEMRGMKSKNKNKNTGTKTYSWVKLVFNSRKPPGIVLIWLLFNHLKEKMLK